MQSTENKEQSTDDSEVCRPSFQTPLQLKATSTGFLGIPKAPTDVTQVRDDGVVLPPWTKWPRKVTKQSMTPTLVDCSLDSAGSSHKTGVTAEDDALSWTTVDSTGVGLVDVTEQMEDGRDTKTPDVVSDASESDETDSDSEGWIFGNPYRLHPPLERSDRKSQEETLTPESSDVSANRGKSSSQEGRPTDENTVNSNGVIRQTHGRGDFQTENSDPIEPVPEPEPELEDAVDPEPQDEDVLLKAAVYAWIKAAVDAGLEKSIYAKLEEAVDTGVEGTVDGILEKADDNDLMKDVDVRLKEAVEGWIKAPVDAGLEEAVDARLDEAVEVWIEEAKVEAEVLIESKGRHFGQTHSEGASIELEASEDQKEEGVDLQSTIDSKNDAGIDLAEINSREENYSKEIRHTEEKPLNITNSAETSSPEINTTQSDVPETKSGETNFADEPENARTTEISDLPEFYADENGFQTELPKAVEMKAAETQTSIFDGPNSEPLSGKSSDTEFSDLVSDKSSPSETNVGFWQSQESYSSDSCADNDMDGKPEDADKAIDPNPNDTTNVFPVEQPVTFVEPSVVSEINEEEDRVEAEPKSSMFYDPVVTLVRCTLGTWMRFWGPIHFQ